MLERHEKLINEVKSLLGLNTYEARTYIALLLGGPGKPGEIAQRAGIPVQRVYDVLRRLRARGLVVEAHGEYSVADPRVALEAKAEEIVLEALSKAEEIKRLGARLAELSRGTSREYVKVVEGITPSIGEALAVISECEETPVFTVLKALDRLEELWPLLRYLVEKTHGPKILIPCGANVPRSLLEEAEELGAQIIPVKCVPLDLMVACDTVILGLPSRASEAVTIVARNPVLAEAVKKRLQEVEREKCGGE